MICAGPPIPCRSRGDAKVIPSMRAPKPEIARPRLRAVAPLIRSSPCAPRSERFSRPETTRAVGGYPNLRTIAERVGGRRSGLEIRRPDTVRDPLAYKLSRLRRALDPGRACGTAEIGSEIPGDERGPRTPGAPERVPGPPSRRPARFPLPTACLSNPPRPPEGHVSSPFGLCTPGVQTSQARIHKIWWLSDEQSTTG